MKQVIEEIKRLVKMSGFNSDDATTVAHILAEFDGSEHKARTALLARLREIYVRNFWGVKNNKKQ